jgi:hypothetical protein
MEGNEYSLKFVSELKTGCFFSLLIRSARNTNSLSSLHDLDQEIASHHQKYIGRRGSGHSTSTIVIEKENPEREREKEKNVH